MNVYQKIIFQITETKLEPCVALPEKPYLSPASTIVLKAVEVVSFVDNAIVVRDDKGVLEGNTDVGVVAKKK